jgi:hypothetical protein
MFKKKENLKNGNTFYREAISGGQISEGVTPKKVGKGA